MYSLTSEHVQESPAFTPGSWAASTATGALQLSSQKPNRALLKVPVGKAHLPSHFGLSRSSLIYLQVLPSTQDALPELSNGFKWLHLFFKSLNALVPLLYPIGQWFKLSPHLNSLSAKGALLRHYQYNQVSGDFLRQEPSLIHLLRFYHFAQKYIPTGRWLSLCSLSVRHMELLQETYNSTKRRKKDCFPDTFCSPTGVVLLSGRSVH